MLRLGAAICGTAILLAYSQVAVAKTSSDDGASRSGASIVGAASTYDPNHPGYREGGQELANGERYNPAAWAAAIQTKLRGEFGGVHHGAKAAYALVESGGKKVILNINDVGPLEPGRVIDLDRQAMRYFDPSLQRGVIPGVKVTPLSGDHWTPGPVG
ncbi:MAG TPA: septal ring lytic transglycosylase RlpA family protein [Xanthobacteraceae bacterium]